MIKVVSVDNEDEFIGKLSKVGVRTSPPLGVHGVANALVPCLIGEFTTRTEDTYHWGVYDELGLMVPESQLRRAGETAIRIRSPIISGPIVPLPGEAVYGGVIQYHFGHFLLETVARLWWVLETGFDGPILFQRELDLHREPDFVVDFFRATGLGNQIRYVDAPIRCERLIIPDHSFETRGYAYAEFLKIFEPLISRASVPADPPRRIFLSRANLMVNGRPAPGIPGQGRLEHLFKSQGYTIVHPEKKPLLEQISLIRGASHIAGIIGSAFHLLIFAQPGKHVTYVCPKARFSLNYPLVDKLIGNQAAYYFTGGEDATATDRQRGSLDLQRFGFLAEQNALFAQETTAS